MSTPKIIRAAQHLLRQISRMAQTLTKGFISGLLRSWLIFSRRTATQAGFVLPTTILLLLVVTLTVGAIGYRTFTRTQQTIGERQQRVIYNAATPAIDRAKAKIEFLFSPDRDRRSGGVPSQTQLLGMMLNDGRDLGGNIRVQPLPGDDPYKLPGESRIDINGDGVVDNAWRYKADLDGDGAVGGANDGTVVYSILFTAPADPATLRGQNVTARATARPFPYVRNAPLSNATQATNACKIRAGTTTGTEQFVPINTDGWFPDEVNTTKLRKNFQVDAYVLPNNPNGAIATLEFQQDREATQGFKWAAWFRNDLEIFPGPAFNWNGAMHTQGNMIMGGSSFRGYMISSKDSCLYTEEASKLTAADITANPAKNIPAFQGQFITGTIRDNNYGGGDRFDLFAGAGRDPVQNQTMDSNSDSVNPTNSRKPADYSLDPIGIQAYGVSVGRTVPNPAVDKDTTGTPSWNETNQFFPRMAYANEDTPYVDDTFRADNRYGPYPRYGRKSDPIPGYIGADIAGNIDLTGDEPPPGADSTSVGLDGYWERRARRDGLRLLVSQRLELGDPAGWGGPDPDLDVNRLLNEPLKPWDSCPSNSTNRCNEARQRRSLWDNLSSVQATAVYHAQSPSGVDFPAACLATTVHPGTAGTLDKSATFENLAYGLPTTAFASPVTPGRDPYLAAGGRSLITSDFFRGRGTNGWEFSAPPTTAFTSVSTSNPWMNALRNLAQYAGDPKGGAPSFTPVQDAINQDQVHPYPVMSMWGDFSMLRRVIGLMDSGVTYASLSPADKTTLHTAGCVIGMLAYNVDYLEKFDVRLVAADPTGSLLLGDANVTNPTALNFSTGLRGTLRLILRRNDPLVLSASSLNGKRLPESIRNTSALNTPNVLATMAFESGSNDPETFVRLMERWRDDPSTSAAQQDELNKQIYLAQLIISKEQVAHDRRLGFFPDRLGDLTLGQCAAWERLLPASGTDEVKRANSEPLFSLCSKRPHFPILYSLFPAIPTDEVNPPANAEVGYSGGFKAHKDISDSTQVRVAREGADDYIRTSNAGASILYRVVRPETVASVPLGITGTTLGSARQLWTLPVVSTNTSGSTPNSNQNALIKICTNDTPCSQPTSSTNRIPKSGALYRTAFKDSALFNGREMMSVRTLDLDLDLMRSTAIGTDFWLPKSGLVYAFREDAVSEAHIVRPYRNTWENCNTDMKLRTEDTCQMRTGSFNANDSTDPPLSSDRKITPKPVDYYADPDRRPHGFRLRNGASLGRTGDDGRGLSFISHNPVYVMGHFNLHRAPGVTSTARADGLEEFIKAQLLKTDFSNFYARKDLDLTFARPESDQWRPSEVLADAVTPLSTEFCDGSIQDGMYPAALPANRVRDRYGCNSVNNNNSTSYLNQDRITASPILTGAATGKGISWMRSTLADSYPTSLPNSAVENPAEGESPIVFRDGNPMTFSNTGPSEYSGSYAAMSSGKTRIDTTNGIQMNMIMVSGLVPSRPNQSYGGLHNFPRFLENWGSDDLFISGAFLQLSFSTYATAPFDQDRWEVSTIADGSTNEDINYYSPPNRRWGYDVGLQYAKAGPVAQRFKFAEAIRSEFYTEPAANDPYIASLKNCAQPATCSAP